MVEYPHMIVRTRMAPSPTGEYHPGHIRTVLYNLALAKKYDGKFILRMEDTDRGRFVEGASERILSVIKDYGLYWDEGPEVSGPYEPYFQSQRLPLYKKYAEELIKSDSAYYCFCSKERLEEVKKLQQEQKLPTTKYDRHCRNLKKEEVEKKLHEGVSYVIRQKVPENIFITFHDEVLGDISVNSNDIEDGVLLKSDGFPTYHLAVVVDDHLMEITHVMRGCDWIPSTPKHVLLYRAFGWDLPKYIHLPNLKEVGSNKKLSKRFGSTEALEFLQEGYLPEAMLNFLMLIGWNSGTEKEIYSLEEFIKEFSVEKLHKTDLVAFDREKLLWTNAYYIRQLSVNTLYEKLIAWEKKFNKPYASNFDKEKVFKVLELIKERLRKFSEFEELTKYFFEEPEMDSTLIHKFIKNEELVKKIVGEYIKLYDAINDENWNKEELDKLSHEKMNELCLSPKEVFMTLRVAVSSREATPPLFDTLEILGKKVVLSRLRKYI